MRRGQSKVKGAPLRKVMERVGSVDTLECGHRVYARDKQLARRCVSCVGSDDDQRDFVKDGAEP